MKLNRPKEITFVIALIIFVVGLLGVITVIPVVSGFAVWLVVIAFLLLALANLTKGL